MKKKLKVTIIISVLIFGIILVDTLQARLLKNSPIISWKNNLEDNDSYVDVGILMDTYYCTKERDIVTVSYHLKGSKFTCPIDNIENESLEKIVKINNELYYNTNKKIYPTCATLSRMITSTTSIKNIPKENDQANFEGAKGIQTTEKNNEIAVFTTEGVYIFKKK